MSVCDLLNDHIYLACGGNNGRARADFVSPIPWQQARAKCESIGFYLATITSRAEDVGFFGMLLNEGLTDTWIGLTDATHENVWTWHNGERARYRNWDDGEPNDGGQSGEDCGIMLMSPGRQSHWDDVPATEDTHTSVNRIAKAAHEACG